MYGGSEEQADVLQNFPHRSGPQTSPQIEPGLGAMGVWGAQWQTTVQPDEVSATEAAAEESTIGGGD